MRKIKCFLSLLLISLLSYYCSKSLGIEDKPQTKIDDGAQAIQVIPDSIISKANIFVISKVGEQFFHSYIKYDSKNSRFSDADSFCIEHPSSCSEFLQKPHYNFIYKLKIPEKVFVDEIIEFVTDTVGNVVSSRDVFGIPVCTNNDCWDNFPLIDKNEVIKIAINNGLEEGIRAWSVSFHFYAGGFDNYVWEVSNTLNHSNSGSNGKTLIIGANNGEIVQSSNWTMIP
jgi:hypothetical protein